VGRRRSLIKDLKRHARLAVAWDRHRAPVPRRTSTRHGLDKTPTLLALESRSSPPFREGMEVQHLQQHTE